MEQIPRDIYATGACAKRFASEGLLEGNKDKR